MFYDDTTMGKIVIIEKYLDGIIDISVLCDKLKCVERTAFRKIAKYKKYGPSGLLHGLKGRSSNNKTSKWSWLERYITNNSFKGRGPTLLAEKIEDMTSYYVPTETLRRKMIELGYRLPNKRKIIIERKKRKRRESYGLLVQFDGSYHDWLGIGQTRCLLLAVDDATGDIVEGLFTQSERLEDIIMFWKLYFQKHGKPGAIYLDRHSSYKVNAPLDQFSEETVTRFQRAMNYLGVEVIFARSAQGKGRVENKFKLLQDRGVKELKLQNIKNYDDAQLFLTKKLIPSLNKKFHVIPVKPGDFHVSMTEKDHKYFEWYFAKITERTINNVGIIEYRRKKYQIPVGQELAGTKIVKVLESHLGNIQIRSGKILLPYKVVG